MMGSDQDRYLHAMGVVRWQVRQTEPDSSGNWASLCKRIQGCQACDLHQKRTHVVVGVGDQQADLMLVGEAPGFYEDQQGEPFVGRAGQLLNAMLRAIQIDRQAVYITNVIKCRPPDNRDPTAHEVDTCTPFLAEQINQVAPKLLLALGRHAAHHLLGTSSPLSRLRGQRHLWQNRIPLLVTYHPAYLLRNPADKAKAYLDWRQISQLLS